MAALQARAGTITGALSLGPGTGLTGQMSIPFSVTSPGSASFDAIFSEASSDPDNCHVINTSLPFGCVGHVSPEVRISSSSFEAVLGDFYDFICGGDASTHGCIETDDFVGYEVICNGGLTLLESASCTIIDLPVGDYLLTIRQNEGVGSNGFANSTVTPFSDSITATLTGNIVETPEPNLGSFCILLLAALLRFIPVDFGRGVTK
jgi:hypothetical protein